jgi:dinuclear metal center YbgI/SA1388 family protein
MADITVRTITSFLESLAPLSYQESYDNAGLITGSHDLPVTGILVTLDCIESVVEEAIQSNCNLIIAHHPIIFKGLKRINGSNYVERTVIKAIKNDMAIYAIHTNLDNVYNGVNQKIASKIGLKNSRVLVPRKETLTKLAVFIPKPDTDRVLQALYDAGAGQIGQYKNCSFRVEGTGSFMPTPDANPYIGSSGQQEFVKEDRVEVIFPSFREGAVMKALRSAHPYEEVAYYLSALTNENQEVGAGIIGELEAPMEPLTFLHSLKSRMELQMIRHTALIQKPVKTVAVCGGAGSFLLPQAIRNGADAYVSADFKYHEFFDADNRLMIADIGHYESEVFTKELLKDILIKKFPTFAINFSKSVTNPISYI